MNEAALKKKIKKILDKKSCWSYAPVQMGMGVSGIPDRVGCMPYVVKPEDVGRTLGLFVGIEAKMDSNKPTPQQQAQLDSIAAAGGIALVVTGDKANKKSWKIKQVGRSDAEERRDLP